MDNRRVILFFVLSFLILQANFLFWAWINPRPEKPVAKQDQQEEKAGEGKDREKDEAKKADKGAKEGDGPDEAEKAPKRDDDEKGRAKKEEAEHGEDDQEQEPPPAEEPAAEVPRQWLTLGSLDPDSDYQALVTLTNRGGAVARVELNHSRYRDLETPGGYLGHLALEEVRAVGLAVNVVGRGTPAEKAGLKPGDVITHFNGEEVTSEYDWDSARAKTKPGQTALLKVAGREEPVEVVLAKPPLSVIQPEMPDIPSLLLTLSRIGDEELEIEPDEEADEDDAPVIEHAELKGLDLRTGNWEVQQIDGTVEFRWKLASRQLEVIKRFRLPKKDEKKHEGHRFPNYHLEFEIEIKNLADREQVVAYQLDGPNGLPVEGWWYAWKVSPHWGSIGLRDVIWKFYGADHTVIGGPEILNGEADERPRGKPLEYVGVDAQYFLAALIPQKQEPTDLWVQQTEAILINEPEVGDRKNTANVSFRLTSENETLAADGGSLTHQYRLFVGPKKPDLLAEYGLGDAVYYGWFGWVARPMLNILHFFYSIIPNYGIAIILLTVLVRMCMFPLSRKQALNAQKMQELQPEIKRINEKYKKNAEQRIKAMQELYRKHNFNPMAGCLPLVIQLPIFIGLYRSLSVDVELRQAALFGESVRWCSNLAAPDMLFRWDTFMPGIVVSWLGPYFNLLPILTIGLFLWQQKMFMPPPADEQAAAQQKVMKFVMVFIGFLFFRVASGLCLYFIASSLWGIAERKLLPRTHAADTADGKEPQAAGRDKKSADWQSTSGNGAQRKKKKKKQQGRR